MKHDGTRDATVICQFPATHCKLSAPSIQFNATQSVNVTSVRETHSVDGFHTEERYAWFWDCVVLRSLFPAMPEDHLASCPPVVLAW